MTELVVSVKRAGRVAGVAVSVDCAVTGSRRA